MISLFTFRFRYLPNLLYFRRANYVRQQWYCYNWLKKRIFWKDELWEFDDVFNNGVEINNTIFVYWKQGWDKVPSIVQKCSDSIKKNNGNHPVVFLDESNLDDYIRFPKHIVEYHQKGIMKEAHFSDILRISLLIKYGGIWCDATCMLTEPIPDYIWNESLFVFQKPLLPEWSSPIKGSNWFIASHQNNILLSSIRNILFTYYSKKKEIINYYIFHLILAVLVDNDSECASLWNDMPYISNMNPHILQFSFEKKYNKEIFDRITNQCFIHKLTYKYKEALLNDKSNILNYLLNNNPE